MRRALWTLATLLSQPVSPLQVLFGKYVGLTLAVWGAIAAGFVRSHTSAASKLGRARRRRQYSATRGRSSMRGPQPSMRARARATVQTTSARL